MGDILSGIIGLVGVGLGAFLTRISDRDTRKRDGFRQVYTEYLLALNKLKENGSSAEAKAQYSAIYPALSLMASQNVLTAIQKLHEECLFDGAMDAIALKSRMSYFEEHEREILMAMRADLKIERSVPEGWHLFSLK